MQTNNRIQVAHAKGVTLPDKNKKLVAVKPMPLPGVVILVHGVNSEGEWFEATEQGLCRGLNRRLARLDDQMVHKGPAAGQLTPATYINSLTPDGFINPQMKPQNYIQPTPSYSPVIHFRWGYKANKEELQEYGGAVFLNEQNYWGGGPFANGCSSLPDLWHEGVNDRLFMWLTVQALNPVASRQVYSTPARHYGVMAALRLAKLIESIRKKQADVPITVVCHSQGNMVGMAAALLGDQLPPVTDPHGKSGRCVADAYVLANAPYSLVDSVFADSWAQRGTKDSKGGRGRQTWDARITTLSNFFDILRARAPFEMDPTQLDKEMANSQPSAKGKPYSATADRQSHGIKTWGHVADSNSGYGNVYRTFGRVTLYCCPHDQVISATTVQGIGWRGMSDYEREVTGADEVFSQRVFASGYTVGQPPGKDYHYLKDDWRYGKGATPGFWFPPSPKAKYSFSRDLDSQKGFIATFETFFGGAKMYLMNLGGGFSVNASPEDYWKVPVDAPKLDEPFEPVGLMYGHGYTTKDGDRAISHFNQGNDPPVSARNKDKKTADKNADDPLDSYKGPAPAQGDAASEASLRYENRAIVREEVRRTAGPDKGYTGLTDDQGNVLSEAPRYNPNSKTYINGYPAQNYPGAVSNDILTHYLHDTETNNPTNHSITMTNPMHAEKALAYDVAIGVCHLTEQDMADLRIEADWRFGKGLSDDNPHRKYAEYFGSGTMGFRPLTQWVKNDSNAHMPPKIIDERDGWLILKL